jgi:hypothetical protein
MASSDIQELNESLAKATSEDSPLTEQQWELLAVVVTAAVTIALLPVAPLVASAGMAAIAAIGPVTSALTIATSAAVGPVLALDALGIIHLTDGDLKLVNFTSRLTGNPFSIIFGAAGQFIDGDYGLETGVSVGVFASFLYDFNDATREAMKAETTVLKDGLYVWQLSKELTELSVSSDNEHVSSRRQIWSNQLNSDSMTRDMLEHISRTTLPLTAKVTENAPPSPSQDNSSAQIRLDRHIFDTPLNPPYSPQVLQPPPPPPPPPTKVPPPTKAPPPVKAPPPAAPAPAPTLIKPPLGNSLGYLVPEHLGGNEPSDSPPPSQTIPDAPEDQTGGMGLP